MIARLPDTLEVPNDQPWSLPFSFWEGGRRAIPRIIADADATMVHPDGDRLDLTRANGRLVVSGADVEFTVPLLVMEALPTGTWELELRAVDASGVHLQIRGFADIVGRI